MDERFQMAVFGGGCFWCTEAVFENLRGVRTVMPGYAGGRVANPTYEQVCSGTTGHAEVIRIEYDPDAISYRDLLEVFFAIHDPTTPNRQGRDVGEQYRSVIFYTTDEQRREALAFITKLAADGTFARPVVTQVLPLPAFYEAEDYHRQYHRKNPNSGYCQVVINPKLYKFKQKFTALLEKKV